MLRTRLGIAGTFELAGTALFASGAATAVTDRIAGGKYAIKSPATLVAPLDAARTAVAAPLAMRAVPTTAAQSG